MFVQRREQKGREFKYIFSVREGERTCESIDRQEERCEFWSLEMFGVCEK